MFATVRRGYNDVCSLFTMSSHTKTELNRRISEAMNSKCTLHRRDTYVRERTVTQFFVERASVRHLCHESNSCLVTLLYGSIELLCKSAGFVYNCVNVCGEVVKNDLRGQVTTPRVIEELSFVQNWYENFCRGRITSSKYGEFLIRMDTSACDLAQISLTL